MGSEVIVERIEHAAKGEHKITFVGGDQPIVKSWGELHEEAKAMAARLQLRGITSGDHVAVLGPTTLDVVTAFQAIWLCGATLVVLPLPMRLASLDDFTTATKARVRAADCAAVLVDPDFAPFIEVEAEDPPLVVLSELAAADGVTANDFIRPDYEPNDVFVLQFTSGSTSEPKGVVLPNHVVAANLDAILEAAEVDAESDVMVSWLPLYHDMGLVGFCILPMSAGLELVLAAPQDFLASPGRWMEWISNYGGTATAGPNFSWVLAARALRRDGVQLDLSSLRIGLNGAEPVDPESVRSLIEAGARHGLRPGAVFPAFGMAEVVIAGSFPKPMVGMVTDIVDSEKLETERVAEPVAADHPNAREIVLLGTPVPGLAFRIVDPETGIELGERRVGELQIRGTSVTPGYYNQDAVNSRLFDDGWLKTGDLAYIVDGQMAMCGRIKDVIIIGGRNVYPQDVERAVGTIEGIRAGNVIAFSSPGRSGKEQIVVVAESRQRTNLDDLRHQVNEHCVHAVGVPCRQVVLVKPSTLPKTSSGKLQRALCRQQFMAGELELVTEEKATQA
ncbi:MAG: AMP-binding protein [Acidimicrobiia bacterium]|nr:AMP-binding protein [Acidimicrobiia bacterium]